MGRHTFPAAATGFALWTALAASAAAQAVPGRPPAGHGPKVRPIELVGVPATTFPHFRFVRVVQETQPVWIAIDPSRYPDLVGVLGDVYVVAARDTAGWQADPRLVDLTG